MLKFIGIMFVMGLAYTQAPLHYSNQNQYLLHGFALAGEGHLNEDWLANTTDPTPVFTWMVALTTRFLPDWVFHIEYVVLFAIYAIAFLGVFQFLNGSDTKRFWTFAALALLLHSALIRWASYRWLGADYPWYFQSGVAGQYILGATLQPSAFGVLLFLSIVLFLREQYTGAVVSLVLGVVMHATYLLPAALLTLGYLRVLYNEGRTREAVRLGVTTFLFVLPVVIYVYTMFSGSGPKQHGAAQWTLVHVRIPHHSIPKLWCDPIAIAQIVWILIALVLARGTRLFTVMWIGFSLAALFTIMVAITDNDSLALLFPWRISTVFVPLSTAIIMSKLVRTLPLWLNISFIVALMIAGTLLMVYRQGYQVNEDEKPLLEFVKSNAASGQTYLIPVSIPDLEAKTYGSLSSDFKPIARKKADSRVIPYDLQRFRLTTGVGIYVDFKSVPYRDVEVSEWHSRLHRAVKWQQRLRDGDAVNVIPELREKGITHIVVTADVVIGGDVKEVYADTMYRVYEL